MRRPQCAVAIAACAVLAGCAVPAQDKPVVHIAEAAKPSPSRPVEQVLPTGDELTSTLAVGLGFTGQRVKGGAEMLLQSVGESDATPVECVSAGYRLQKVAYAASPVLEVASESWAGGDFNGPPVSGFFGVVKFATPADAQAFFAAAAEKWRRCNGQTLVLHQPEHGADGMSKITDVLVQARTVSAVVLNDTGETVQRALGVASDSVVDVEVTAPNGADGAAGAVAVATLMQRKVG